MDVALFKETCLRVKTYLVAYKSHSILADVNSNRTLYILSVLCSPIHSHLASISLPIFEIALIITKTLSISMTLWAQYRFHCPPHYYQSPPSEYGIQ